MILKKIKNILKYEIRKVIDYENSDEYRQNKGWKVFKKQNSELCKQVEKNAQFKDKYSGKRCFVIGNGPSLLEQDLTLLENEYVFTVNQITRNPDYPKIKSNFHFYADPVFFKLNKDNDADMDVFAEMKKINTADNKPIVFFPQTGYAFSKEFELEKELNMHYYAIGLTLHKGMIENIDFAKFVPGFHTVIQYAVYLAMYMGFKEIYLLGCDCTSIVTAINTRLNAEEGALYAYEVSDNERKRIDAKNKKISMESESLSNFEVFQKYRYLNDYAVKNGIRLINCTKGGVLDSLPRMRYEDVIKSKEKLV